MSFEQRSLTLEGSVSKSPQLQALRALGAIQENSAELQGNVRI